MLQISVTEEQSVLTINPLIEIDTGELQCVITNQNGSEKYSANLDASMEQGYPDSEGTQGLSVSLFI